MGNVGKVTWLGLGAMGRPMARRVLEAGHELTVWSRSGVPMDFPEGARSARDVREAVQGADVVLSMLKDDSASRAVWLEAGGIVALKKNAIAVECSTLSSPWVTELAHRVEAWGAGFVAAPVVGSLPQAAKGELVILAGGAEAQLERMQALFAVLGKRVVPLSAPSVAAQMKLIVNGLLGAQIALVAEFVGLGDKAGVERETLRNVLSGLVVTSGVAERALDSIVDGRFEPLFPVELAHKDLRYVTDHAASLGAPLPVTNAARDVFARAVEAGLGGQHMTAVVKLLTQV